MAAVNYLWNPLNDNIVREFDDAGTVIAEYTTEANQFGNVVSQRRSGQDSVYHYEGQGSTLALTNANGDVTDTYAYSAFGDVTAHTGTTVNPFQYIGQKGYYWDEETGECDVRQRSLSSRRGRWLSPDPLESFMFYLYARNNPAATTDPSGLYDLDFSPTSPIGAPWCRVGRDKPILDPLRPAAPPKPADPNGLRVGVYGDTKPIHYGIDCACICHNLSPIQYMIKCRLWAYLQIRIAPDNFVGRHSEKGVYGHEQRHVRNLLEAAETFAKTHVTLFEDDVYKTFDHCLAMKGALEAFVQGEMNRVLAAEEAHDWGPYLNKTGDGPWAGKDMQPLPGSKMPPKPDCTLPGKPKPGLDDKHCCEIVDRFGPNPVE